MVRTLAKGGALRVTKIELELPDATVEAARDAGLLTPQALELLLKDATERRRAADAPSSVAGRVASAGIEPMSMEEIAAEVKATRTGRGQGSRITPPFPQRSEL